MNGQDRRVHPRRSLEENVYGYVDGRRIDARTADISAGGAFLASRQAASVPKGALLGVVFQDESSVRHRIFLFGRVVRHEDFPRPGIGLCFERAVTAGPRTELVAFLVNVVGVTRTLAELNTGDDEGGNRRVFVFPARSTESSPEADKPPPTRPTAPLQRAAVLQEYAPTPTATPKRPAGPMTQQITVDGLRARTDLMAIIEGGLRPFPATVSMLGVKGATLEIENALTGRLDDVGLTLDIPIRDASVPLRCRCQVTSIEPAKGGALRVDVTFRSVDEGGTPGVLQAYVRWLFQRSMARADADVPPRRSH
jgi:hypothetical protein